MEMRRVRASDKHVKLIGFVAALASVAIASAVLADLMVTNAAGVRAGITGIVYRPATNGAPNGVGVRFAIRDPTGTNVTTFAIQRSLDLTTWTNYSTMTVTGNYPITGVGSAEIGDPTTSTAQFYRMQLINF